MSTVQKSESLSAPSGARRGRVSTRDRVLAVLPIVILLVVVIILGIFTPNFMTPRNTINVLEQASALALMAVGMTAVMIGGGIDLSLPANLALAGVLGALFMRSGGNPLIAALIMIAGGTGVGMINGYAVAYFRMIPFVVTLAMQFIAVGAATWLTESVSISNLPMSFVDTVQSRLGTVPVHVVLVILLVVVCALLFQKSYFGRWLYAVGTNARAARVSGVPAQRVIFGTYAFAGLMAGLAAVITVGRLMSASALMAGENVVLDVISSAVVGGVSIYGGVGNPLGAALGALLITLISNSMNMLRVSYYLTLVIKGIFIIVFIWLNSLRRR